MMLLHGTRTGLTAFSIKEDNHHANVSMATSAVASGTTADTSRAIVNWDVAASEWRQVKENVHTAWLKLKADNG